MSKNTSTSRTGAATTVPAFFALTLLALVPAPAHALVEMATIEGESAKPIFCLEDGISVKPLAGASGDFILFFGFDGCRAQFLVGAIDNLGLVTGLRFTTTGNFGNTVCGSWVIIDDGFTVGRSLEACGDNLEWHEVPIVPPALVDSRFDIVWRPGLNTPAFANGLLDFVTVAHT